MLIHAYMKDRLNFPEFEFTVQDRKGKLSIFDSLRKKYLIVTPEEWVRQHMIRYLIEYHQYPRSLFSLEKGLYYNTLQKRTDILILDRTGSPFLLIECKAPEIKLSQKTVEQVAIYNSQIKAAYIGITNGRSHLFLKLSDAGDAYIQLQNVPQF